MHKYKLKYSLGVDCGKFTQEEIFKEQEQNENLGATDALLWFSLIYPEDGSFSMKYTSIDGRTDKDLEDKEIFKVWSMLSKRLADSETLDEGRRKIAGAVWETLCKVITDNKKRDQ